MFVPMLSICSCTCFCAPWPRLTIAITDATPIMMPSIVSADRTLLRASARNAIFRYCADHNASTSWSNAGKLSSSVAASRRFTIG